MSKGQKIAQAYFKVQQLQKMSNDVALLKSMQEKTGAMTLQIASEIVAIKSPTLKDRVIKLLIEDLANMIDWEAKEIDKIKIE